MAVGDSVHKRLLEGGWRWDGEIYIKHIGEFIKKGEDVENGEYGLQTTLELKPTVTPPKGSGAEKILRWWRNNKWHLSVSDMTGKLVKIAEFEDIRFAARAVVPLNIEV